MTRIKFRQLTPVKKMLFIFLYLAVLLNALFYYFGFVEVINFINSFSVSSGKVLILSFLAVVLALFPILVLVKYTGDKYIAVVNSKSLMLFKKDKLHFTLHLKDIHKMEIKHLSVKPLIIYGENEAVLIEIQPYELKKDKSSVVFQITEVIQKYRTFEEKEITQKQFGYPHQTNEFIAKPLGNFSSSNTKNSVE